VTDFVPCKVELLYEEAKRSIDDFLVKRWVDEFDYFLGNLVNRIPPSNAELVANAVPLPCEFHSIVRQEGGCHRFPALFDIKEVVALMEKPPLELGMA
jgi:hypothetical protein